MPTLEYWEAVTDTPEEAKVSQAEYMASRG